MNALRQAIAAIWAAVWVRWRLLAVASRRLLGGGGRAAVAGSGYYLSPAEIPVEGVDYELMELPPELAARLDAARVELVDGARSATARRVRGRRRRRRRTTSLAMAALVSLAALGAGATALVGGSTGVPAIDRLLGTYEAGLEKPGSEGRSGRGLPQAGSGASESIEVWVDERSRRLVSLAYVDRHGKVCSISRENGGPGKEGSGRIGCVVSEFVADRLVKQPVLIMSTIRYGKEVVVTGFADRRVKGLEGRGPNGRFPVRLGPEWIPDVAGLSPLKPFVAVVPIDDASSGDLLDLDLAFEGTTGDGEVFDVVPE